MRSDKQKNWENIEKKCFYDLSQITLEKFCVRQTTINHRVESLGRFVTHTTKSSVVQWFSGCGMAWWCKRATKSN